MTEGNWEVLLSCKKETDGSRCRERRSNALEAITAGNVLERRDRVSGLRQSTLPKDGGLGLDAGPETQAVGKPDSGRRRTEARDASVGVFGDAEDNQSGHVNESLENSGQHPVLDGEHE